MTTPPQLPVTLATIAAHLGVSRSTVSNAYNHPDQLSPQLRQKIFDTAASLGYTGPDPVARRLRQRQAGAIGVLFSEALQTAFADEASVLFLEGIADAGEETDSGMMLIPARPSQQSATVVQNAIVDGFILYSIPPGHPFVEAALRRRLPIVCVDQTHIDGVAWVGIDDQAAAQSAAHHLIELGHRRIAILVYGLEAEHVEASIEGVTSEPTPSVSRLRLQGYAKAFAEADLDWSTAIVRECNVNSSEAGAEAVRELLTQTETDRPTAILCTSDALALGVLQEAARVDVTVPEQLSIVGFNDLPSAATSNPPLTTVRQPLRQKGAEAASLLLEGFATAEHRVQLEAELIVRKSSGPAPAQ